MKQVELSLIWTQGKMAIEITQKDPQTDIGSVIGLRSQTSMRYEINSKQEAIQLAEDLMRWAERSV